MSKTLELLKEQIEDALFCVGSLVDNTSEDTLPDFEILRTAIYSLRAENTRLKAEIVRKDAVLQELSCLGNGGTPGNSIGNLIAQTDTAAPTTKEKSEAEILAFVKEAADKFAVEGVSTYGDVEGGKYLALRWGILDRGIVVIKIDKDFPPRNFVDAVGATNIWVAK